MIKPPGLIGLIIVVLLGGYFLHGGGCNGQMLLAGSPPVPDTSGIHIKSAGGWQSVNNPPMDGMLPGQYRLDNEFYADQPLYVVEVEKIGFYPTVNISGTTLQVGTRSMGLSFTDASVVVLYPLDEIIDSSELSQFNKRFYSCLTRDVAIGVTQNLSKPEDNYTLVEIDNMPTSSTGMYLLAILVENQVIIGQYAYVVLTTN